MTVDAISFLSAVAAPLPTGAAPPAVAPAPFAEWFGQQLQSVNMQLIDANREVQHYAAGGAVSVHDMMIKLEEAKLSLQLLMAVRSKALDALSDVLRMPM